MSTRDEEIKIGIELATNHEGPWEFGVYRERNDGRNGEDDWIPIISTAPTEEWARDVAFESGGWEHNRNVCVVRRAVSPWEECP